MADDNTWSLADAKARLSEVVDRALNEGPQRITRHGKPAVIVTAESHGERVERPKTIHDVLLDPKYRGLLTRDEADTLFARDKDPGRIIEI